MMSPSHLTTLHGTAKEIPAEKIEALATAIRGQVIDPDHSEFDEARQVYNAMHDLRPGLIVRASGTADVIETVRFAAEENLLLAVRGGGHSVPGFGTCEGGLVLDMARMRGLRVDAKRKTARAEGGCTWGDFNHGTQPYGLATTGGIVSTTGIGGLTLGGGMGYLTRQFGLSCDNLVSADVVTSSGEIVTCNSEENEDLFWAIRGGGGNFGVVTSFEYALHDVGEIFGGPTFYRLDPGVLESYLALMKEAPEELGAIFALALAPPLPFVPEEWHGKPVAAVLACWNGEESREEAIKEQLSGLGPMVGQALWRMPYPVINTLFDELLPRGLYHYWKANFARSIPDEAIAAHIEKAADTPTIESGTFIMPIDGACHRVDPADTAFAYRQCDWSVVVAGAWSDPADNGANTEWVRDYYNALEPYSEDGGYVNFMSDDDQGRVESNYGPNFQRLQRVKAKFDPDNRFRVNQNIAPTA
ncbi:FAD-binding oxidoreductase [Limibacillus halophilus]